MQTKHTSEIAARKAARALGNTIVQIVASFQNPKEGRHDPMTFFYLESDNDMSMIRNWEKLVYSGKGGGA